MSLDEFVHYDELLTSYIKKKYEVNVKVNVGGQTIEFIEMFFKDAGNVLKNLSNEYLNDKNRFRSNLVGAELLNQDRLNEELISFLECSGYTHAEAKKVSDIGSANVTESPSVEVSQYVVDYVLDKERLLYAVYKYCGIDYKKGTAG